MEGNITGLMTTLIFQISIIIFAVKIFGSIAEKLGFPSVIGELLSGVVIGPFALGAIPLPGFPHGLFPVYSDSLAVTPELYGFAMVASIILLFNSGLETDLGLFLRYSVRGGIIGISGVVFSFIFGAVTCMAVLHTHFWDERCLFFGIMSTATSVGITARIISDRKKMDSPEGVTTLAAAVFDDVLGIVLLAIVMGLVAAVNQSGSGSHLDANAILNIAVRAFGIWLGLSALALICSKSIAFLLKKFRSSYDFSIFAFGIAMLLAGIFEKQGLAMIIGAYITGLALSRTDIAPIILDRLEGVTAFLVPLFFCVMGMMVHVAKLFDAHVLLFGLVYTVACILGKLIGCGWPALYLGFNMHGALRIGCGMVPRGEVALIIAGIGITAGILDEQLFGVVIMMTLVTTIIAPPALSIILMSKQRGTRKELKSSATKTCHWDFKTREIADLVTYMLITDLRKDGFFVLTIDSDKGIYHARMNRMVFTITQHGKGIDITTKERHEQFLKTSMYEVLLRFMDTEQSSQQQMEAVAEARKESAETKEKKVDVEVLQGRISKDLIICNLKAGSKEEAILELVDLVSKSPNITDRKVLLDDIMQREAKMSTGMEHGIAFPHAKSEGVKHLTVAIGRKKSGIEFDSLDGLPSQIFVLIASPTDEASPHLQVLAAMSGVLSQEENRKKILNAKSAEEIASVFSAESSVSSWL
ncbi:MAG: cation:proton antiporter [Spirochaetales bacterium]|nr:cation:proton antiporter [Spirochaetales bacterium]